MKRTIYTKSYFSHQILYKHPCFILLVHIYFCFCCCVDVYGCVYVYGCVCVNGYICVFVAVSLTVTVCVCLAILCVCGCASRSPYRYSGPVSEIWPKLILATRRFWSNINPSTNLSRHPGKRPEKPEKSSFVTVFYFFTVLKAV